MCMFLKNNKYLGSFSDTLMLILELCFCSVEVLEFDFTIAIYFKNYFYFSLSLFSGGFIQS